MAAIALTNGGVALIDDEDFARVSRLKWCWLQRKGDTVRYAVATIRIDGRTVYMHKFIFGHKPGQQVDHRNLDGLDNTRANLRGATPTQNAQNRGLRRGKICQFKGVSINCGKYRARIRVNGRLISLGYFATEIEAARAYDTAALEHFGDFARLNLPERGVA